MTSIGTGYDLSASIYSPDGRLFQVEYANKAVENSGTAIGLRVKDGVVLALEKPVHSKLLLPGANKRITNVDRHVGFVAAGIPADGKYLTDIARQESSEYRTTFRLPIPVSELANRLALFMQQFTLRSSLRPFGISPIIAAVDKNGPQLYVIEPSGVYHGYVGAAVGKGKTLAKTELEKLNLAELSTREAVIEAARIIHLCHDDAKEKDFELEMSWIGAETNNVHTHVPADLFEEADSKARAALENFD